MTTIRTTSAALAMTFSLAIALVAHSAEVPVPTSEVDYCLAAVTELSGGNPPANAVALCHAGETSAAIDALDL